MVIEKRMYDVKEIIVANGGILPLGLSTVYAYMKQGKIPYKKIGDRMLIPFWYLENLLKEDAKN